MKRLAFPLLLIAATGCGPAGGDADAEAHDGSAVSQALGTVSLAAPKHIHRGQGAAPAAASPAATRPAKGLATPAGESGNNIIYNGGPVMSGRVSLYLIWYGNWGADTGPTILTDLARSITPSFYVSTNSSYTDTTQQASNNVVYGGSTTDNSHGTALSDNNIAQIVGDAIGSGRLPSDANGIYMVMTAPGVSQGAHFSDSDSSSYCGWHSYSNIGGQNTKVGFVGNPSLAPKPGACIWQTTSPNGNAGADAMASVLMHEVSETITDPLLDAWSNPGNGENGDLCAWQWGPMNRAASGAYSNAHFGTRDYLVQQLWVNALGGFCSMSYPQTPIFRYYKAATNDHFYTDKWQDPASAGYSYEGIVGRFYETHNEIGMVPFYRYYNASNGQHFYTSNPGEVGGGYSLEGIIGYVYSSSRRSTIPVYRYSYPPTGSHFYTTNWAELGSGGAWTYEGIVGYVSPAASGS